MTKASSIATALLALSRTINSSDACSCAEQGSFQLQDYESVDRIFECLVVRMSVSGPYENSIECEVPMVYKGNGTAEKNDNNFSVTTSSSTASCGFPFELRGTVLVYQEVDGSVNLCGRTSWLESDESWIDTSQAEQDVEELMALIGRNLSDCGVEMPSMEDAFKDAARVFECSVIAEASSVSTEDPIPHVSAVCEVNKIYKGEQSKDERSLGNGIFLTEGFAFSEGEYLVYQSEDGTVPKCGRTAPLASQVAQQDIVGLRKLTGEERERALLGLRNFHM